MLPNVSFRCLIYLLFGVSYVESRVYLKEKMMTGQPAVAYSKARTKARKIDKSISMAAGNVAANRNIKMWILMEQVPWLWCLISD